MQSETANHRRDIQAMRGIAVLLVLFYHAGFYPFENGYLGVDIFFVISGYLITLKVLKDLEAGTFGFFDFYIRRAKRLLPAAYVTFAATAAIAPFVLTSAEFRDFTQQLIGSVAFAANFVLWRQAGYFGGEAALKPLLHIWSLSLEEQYYLFLPALLVFTPSRFRGWALIALTAVSLTLCIFLLQAKPPFTFYLPFTRAWELAIGSLGAFLVARRSQAYQRLVKTAFWPSFFALLLLPTVGIPGPHPGLSALIVCIATLVLILRCHETAFANSYSGPLVWTGNISYSLYLVHWPLFAFLNNIWLAENGIDNPPFLLRLTLLALSFALAYCLYRYIEYPIHKMKAARRGRLTFSLAGSSALMVCIGFVIVWSHSQSPDDPSYAQRANRGFSSECDMGSGFHSRPICRNSDTPEVLVWGDSFAMHLVPGLAKALPDLGVQQATRSACGPFPGIAPVSLDPSSPTNEHWAQECIRFNDDVLAYISSTPSITHVVLSSSFHQYLSAEAYDLMVRDQASNAADEGRQEPVLASLRNAADKIRRMGKEVVVISATPQNGLNFARCEERLASGLPLMRAQRDSGDCSLLLEDYTHYRKGVRDLIAGAKASLGVPIIDMEDILCTAHECRTKLENVLLYRDQGHLSYDGSVALFAKMIESLPFGDRTIGQLEASH